MNCSKYLFEDDKQLNITADHIEVGDPANLDFITTGHPGSSPCAAPWSAGASR